MALIVFQDRHDAAQGINTDHVVKVVDAGVIATGQGSRRLTRIVLTDGSSIESFRTVQQVVADLKMG